MNTPAITASGDPAPWQPIASAPRDGTVILTDEGTGKYVDQKHWGSPVRNGWYLSTWLGDIPICADDGMSVSAIEPKFWMPLPTKLNG